jgi:hypothetical protein
MVKRFPVQVFFKKSQKAWSELPDSRQPSPNRRYEIADAVNSAMSVFFMQSPSFLSHQQEISRKRKGQGNLQSLFEGEQVPSDNQIRNLPPASGSICQAV